MLLEPPSCCVSGYTPEADKVDELLSAHPTVAYLEKPYDPNTFAVALSELLPAAAAFHAVIQQDRHWVTPRLLLAKL